MLEINFYVKVGILIKEEFCTMIVVHGNKEANIMKVKCKA
jgi:hypothetical protein